MSVTVVWLDLEKAKLFHLSEERMLRENVRATRVEHHTHRLENDELDCVPMYDEVAKRLKDSTGILVLGPGLARKHFVSRLETAHPEIAKRVVGCEASDHPSDQQIAAYALRYFQKPKRSEKA
jgi:stalled ribosome rescue protein Dom34